MFKYKMIFLLLILSQTFFAQTSSDKSEVSKDAVQALTSIKLKVDLLKTSQKSSRENMLLDNTERSVNVLVRIIDGKEVSNEYISSIKLNDSLLEKYRTKKSIKYLEIVASDFGTKATFAENFPDAPTEKVIVTFITQNPGYWVYHILEGNYGAENPDRCGNRTNEAEAKLIPGTYYVWAEKDKKEYPSDTLKAGKNAKRDNKGDLRETFTLRESN